jgi:hypothetical protein
VGRRSFATFEVIGALRPPTRRVTNFVVTAGPVALVRGTPARAETLDAFEGGRCSSKVAGWHS